MAGASGRDRGGSFGPPSSDARSGDDGSSSRGADADLRAAVLDTEWLYEEDEQVFGPISTRVLLGRLYDGTLSVDTPVALEGGTFTPIREIAAFASHRQQVATHRARQAEAAAAELEARRRRVRRRLGWVALGGFVLSLGSVAMVLGVRRFQAAQAEAIRKAKEQAMLAELDDLMARVTIEPPLEALVGGQDESDPSPRRRQARRSRRRRPALPDRVDRPLSRREVLRGVRPAFGGFKRCIVAQIQRDRGSVGSEIVLLFSIGNDGRARDISVRDRFLRESPLRTCLARRMENLKWRSFTGEVRNVEYPISIRR